MKPAPLALFAALSSITIVHSQDKETALPPVPASSPTNARIVGTLSDGSSSPPESPKPELVVQAEDILETRIHQQDNRQIIIREINPIELPALPETVQAIADPAPMLNTAELQDSHSNEGLLRIGATVYRSTSSAPRTLATFWQQGEEPPITFWSSADFALLSGFATFIGSDNRTHSLMMSWSSVNMDRLTELTESSDRTYTPPQIPDLPEGKASFSINSGTPTQETLASIQSLHDLYNNEYDRLKEALEGRERARMAKEAELIANPPGQKDIIINYWRMETPKAAASEAPTEGGDK
jgi:hypothetical protein